jgi:hypothetical protein
MDPALTPSMALCFFGITDDSVSHPSDSIRLSLCCSDCCGCGALEEDGADAAGDDIAAATVPGGWVRRKRGGFGKREGPRSMWVGPVIWQGGGMWAGEILSGWRRLQEHFNSESLQQTRGERTARQPRAAASVGGTGEGRYAEGELEPGASR